MAHKAKTAVTKVEDKFNEARKSELAKKVGGHRATKTVVSTAKTIGSFLWSNACKVGSAIDSKINKSEKLSHAKEVTKTKFKTVKQVLNTNLVEVIDKVAATKKGDKHLTEPVIGSSQ